MKKIQRKNNKKLQLKKLINFQEKNNKSNSYLIIVKQKRIYLTKIKKRFSKKKKENHIIKKQSQ